jgi:SDR family mycofactocin-dependent oxidoreductase
LDGKVAFVTGAGRGQGRAEAVRLAKDGADVIICDVCAPIEGLGYATSGPDDLAETVRLVEGEGRKVLARAVDVRDLPGLEALVADGVEELGHLDIVVANAGILSAGRVWELTPEQWQQMIDVNLTGVWNTIKAAVPTMVEQGTGGAIVLTSSVGGLRGIPFTGHYNAAKHGVVGLARTLANELGEYDIRVNSIHPAGVDTAMVREPALFDLIKERSRTLGPIFMNTLPHHYMSPDDLAAVVAFLVSDEARYMTGVQVPVDFGNLGR